MPQSQKRKRIHIRFRRKSQPVKTRIIHSLKSEAEILVEIEAKILEVDEDAFLDAYKDREGSPNVISDSQANILLNALTREEATDLLCAPRITVKNGEKAEIKVVQEFVIPTGKPSEQTTGGGVGRQVQEIGFELAVTPTVQKNNQIHLQLNPKVTQFDGFVESGGPSDPTGGIGFSKRLPPGILMPTFSTRKIATQVTLTDGATAIIGGTRVEIKKVNEKIPVLGNLPLVCGLFSTESNQTRSLIMFVSAKIASAESSPDRENIQNNTSQSTSKDPGKLLAELNLEKLRTEQKLNEDHSLVKSEAEILVEIEAKILEVDEDAFPDAYKDLEGSTNVIPDSQASILLNALTREEATDLLSTHHITVKNGEKAEIKVVQEFVFPSFPTGKPSTQATGEGDGRQVREIGFELSVTPTVQKNYQNQFIDLQLSRKITELDGFVEYGGPSDPTGGIGFSKRLPSGILIPVFSVRKIAPQYTVLDGTTVIIGELSRKEEKNYNYKIPVSTESNQTRSLLMFVSAKIASTESSPDRENIQNNTSQSTFKDPGKLLAELNLEKLRTEQKLNEQLDKANKKLDEILAIYNIYNQQIIAE